MNVIARKTLKLFWERHADAEGPLKAWFSEVEHALWKGPADIRRTYGSADFLQGNRVVFNIGGNKYRLIVKIAYTPRIVYIRFVGTHAEYDSVDAESI